MNRQISVDVSCRLCAAPLPPPFLNLGAQPLPDMLIDPRSPAATTSDPVHPTALTACVACGLIQLTVTPPAEVDVGHGHGVEASASLAAEDRRWAARLAGAIPAGDRWKVIIAGDRWALAPAFEAAGHAVAPSCQVDADLIIANHSLAHADDLSRVLSGFAEAIRPGGLLAIETHHALGLARGQFDIVTPVHRTYLSLACLEPALGALGLSVIEASIVDRHGGSLRVLARRGSHITEPKPETVRIIAGERAAGLDDPRVLGEIGARAESTRSALRGFLTEARANGRLVIGYGAASRGVALLNAVDVTTADLPMIVDRSPSKQGLLTPGGRIPISDPAMLATLRPSDVLVLPWPLIDEIAREQAGIQAWGGRFVVALPTLTVRAAGPARSTVEY
jgi:SAM-dependent methyltransferase